MQSVLRTTAGLSWENPTSYEIPQSARPIRTYGEGGKSLLIMGAFCLLAALAGPYCAAHHMMDLRRIHILNQNLAVITDAGYRTIKTFDRVDLHLFTIH